MFGQGRKSLTIQMCSLITAVQMLSSKLDFYKVKMGIELHMKWLLKRTGAAIWEGGRCNQKNSGSDVWSPWNDLLALFLCKFGYHVAKQSDQI